MAGIGSLTTTAAKATIGVEGLGKDLGVPFGELSGGPGMSKTVRVNATMDQRLVDRIDAFAARRFEDRSTAIRQLFDYSLRELQKNEALDAYRSGRLTLRELGRALGLDAWATHDLLASEGIPVTQGDREETAHALQELLAKSSRARR
jgi:Uncharacterised protein family (UPF0175)